VRHGETLFPPELAAHDGERVGEGWAAFAIPCTGRDSLACLRRKLRGQQGDQEEQAEQAGRRACDGLVRPLALRLHPEVVAHLAERDFQLPALNKPAQDLHGILGSIGAQQGLRLEPAEGIAHQHPTDRDDGHPAVAPDSGGGADLDDALAAAIPTRYCDAFPWCGRVGQHLGQGRQALALGPGPSVGAGQAGRCRVVKRGVKAQAG